MTKNKSVKTILLSLLTLAVLLCGLAGMGTATASAAYSGVYEAATLINNAEDPHNGYYKIETVGQLYWFAALVNGDTTAVPGIEGDSAAKAVLANDLALNPNCTFTLEESGTLTVKRGEETVTDLGSLNSWVPIGNVTTPFTGIFDGNGHRTPGFTLRAIRSVNRVWWAMREGRP